MLAIIRKDSRVEEDFEWNLWGFNCDGTALLKHLTSNATDTRSYHQNEPHSKASEPNHP